MLFFKQTVGMIETNCYIIADDDTREAAVIDPGDDAGKIISIIRKNSLKVKYIILTHGHFDHVLAIPQLLKNTDAKIIAYVTEVERLANPERLGHNHFAYRFSPVKVDIPVNEGDTIKLGGITLEFYHTPGHTEGSMCISAGDHLFTGDTLFEGSCGRCDMPGGDYEQMLKSLRKLYFLDSNYKVYPGHGGATTLENERHENFYMQEAVNK